MLKFLKKAARKFLGTFVEVPGTFATKLRVQLTVDGVLLPDLWFDHPNFQGVNCSLAVFAESAPAVTDQYVLTASQTVSSTSIATLHKNAGVYATDDSRNPANYAP